MFLIGNIKIQMWTLLLSGGRYTDQFCLALALKDNILVAVSCPHRVYRIISVDAIKQWHRKCITIAAFLGIIISPDKQKLKRLVSSFFKVF